jgi:hypothetical protein
MGHLTKKRMIVGALILLAACDGGRGEIFPTPPPSPSPSPFPSTPTLASPTPPALPERPPSTSGDRSDACVDGWKTPRAGSPLAVRPLRILERTVHLPGEPEIVEMRYFTGPESPPSEKGYILTIERWYVKLYTAADLRFQGRFLIESRELGNGVAAVAAYDTEGYRSPDWSGFQWNEADPKPRPYPGLPGEWSGIRYDFVKGGAGLNIPGLPVEVRGCVETT